MPTVMDMKWAGVTPEQYEEMRGVVNWEGDKPDGAIHHIAWFDDNGLRVVDIWDSGDQFNRFVEDRLMPGVRQVGVEGQPEVTLQQTHAVFAPGYE